MELWVTAIGFEGLYEVSNLGNVKSLGRWVSNGNGQRFVKERIKKLSVYNGRISVSMCVDNVQKSVNLPAMIYFSFNTKEKYLDKTYCVCHINKIQTDNTLNNLSLVKISDSHKINHVKKLLPHLKINNDKRKLAYDQLTHKVCTDCLITKEIINFEHGRNKCKVCRKMYYYNKK